MKFLLQTSLTIFLTSICFSSAQAQDDWSRWRGPDGNGIAAIDQQPPTTWSEDTNVVWKVEIPGRGHASPIVLGNQIFLATANEKDETQSVISVDRKTGQKLWQTEINHGEFNPQLHPKNTHASPTIATDGKRLFVVFNNHRSIQLAALDLSGKIAWQKKVGKYESDRPFGFGATPIIYQDRVIVTNHCEGDPGVMAFATRDGTEKWRIDSPAVTNYATPVVAKVGGINQLLISGQDMVASYDPDNGKEFWHTSAKWEVACATMVWDKDLVFASGGYPAQQTLAIKANGSGEMVWENSVKCYEQSMLAHDGFIYAHSDNGGVYCWAASDGKEMWKERFGARNPAQSASPVLANGNIYFTAENGETLVIKANPNKLEEVARNKLGDEAFASLAICGNQIFARVALIDPLDNNRQEWLFCLGDSAK